MFLGGNVRDVGINGFLEIRKNQSFVLNVKVLIGIGRKGVKNKMPYKWVRKWVPGYYYYKNGKRVHVRGHYKRVQVWVSSRRK